jgi:hypothetical protein
MATVFSSLASKLVATVFSGLTSKLVVMVSPDLASKLVVEGFRFGPQNRQLRFGDLGLKIKRAAVCRLRHKTNGGMRWRRARIVILWFVLRGSKSG